MKNIACKVTFNTNYNFKVIRQGKLIQEENTHNVIMDKVWSQKNYYIPSHSCYAFGKQLVVGDGTGTPSGADSALFHQLWTVESQTPIKLVELNDETHTITARYVFELPANASYVGTITECGLRGYLYNSLLYTHALIRDAEGNPISINKTDLDRVIITIDITMILGVSDPDIEIVPMRYNAFRYALKCGSYSNFDYLNCMTYDNSTYSKRDDIIHFVQSPQAILQRGMASLADNYGFRNIYAFEGMPRVNNQTTIVDDNVRNCIGRVAQDAYAQGKVGYLKAIVIFGTFVIKLPNANYFPSYPLKNIEVGVAHDGDTELLCPLDHFVKDSEVIYKNGIALTRDVDYTVDSDNNHRGLVELTAANDAIITGGIPGPLHIAVADCELFRAKSSYTNTYATEYPESIVAFSTAAPLFFDMQKEVTLNFLRVPTDFNQMYKLYYSEDGEIYELHATHTFNATDGYVFEFIPVTARYFKLEVTTPTGGSINVGNSYIPETSVDAPEKFFALGYKTDGMIKFTTPLVEGDIITMDCMMDLPYKTFNNVIDYDFSISL